MAVQHLLHQQSGRKERSTAHAVNKIHRKHMDVSLTICDAYEESLNDSSAERKILLKKGDDIIDRESIKEMFDGGERFTFLVTIKLLSDET